MPKFLIAESETEGERSRRRDHAGKSSAESYAATLCQMSGGGRVDIVYPADEDADALSPEWLAGYDAIFLSGSPMHVYHDTPDVRRQLSFMREVFASGTPSFGSCAGLQVAVAATGGTVRKMARRMEAGIARRIVATDTGRTHPMLAGRPASWDAPAIHGDEVAELPPCATLLASNGASPVQAIEIRHDRAVFWGVQYHPELAPGEIGAALRRQASDLVAEGLARDDGDVADQAEWFDVLQEDAASPAARWHLGVDDEYAIEDLRRRELRNFLTSIPALRNKG